MDVLDRALHPHDLRWYRNRRSIPPFSRARICRPRWSRHPSDTRLILPRPPLPRVGLLSENTNPLHGSIRPRHSARIFHEFCTARRYREYHPHRSPHGGLRWEPPLYRRIRSPPCHPQKKQQSWDCCHSFPPWGYRGEFGEVHRVSSKTNIKNPLCHPYGLRGDFCPTGGYYRISNLLIRRSCKLLSSAHSMKIYFDRQGNTMVFEDVFPSIVFHDNRDVTSFMISFFLSFDSEIYPSII